MAATLLGTAFYAVWCRRHGLVGLYDTTDNANAGCSAHWTAQHAGHGWDQTDSDNTVAQLAELFISQVNRTVPTDVT
jgi:hypothetical protein